MELSRKLFTAVLLVMLLLVASLAFRPTASGGGGTKLADADDGSFGTTGATGSPHLC